ncbi:MAG: hypothetical protein EOP53_23000 [Sphingobacteriales bacterium]|nr:MAG: hypothetical protein EOP53_23000 [Sphingobacteriales bacterium]
MTTSKRKPKISLKAVPLEEGDYYLNENGYMVFTKQYHLRRGFCCGSKCKHCPYNWENVQKL